MKSVCHDSGRELISTADLDDVVEVDESAMEIEEFVYRNVRYAATPPLRFNVTYDRAGALYSRLSRPPSCHHSLPCLWGRFGVKIEATQ